MLKRSLLLLVGLIYFVHTNAQTELSKWETYAQDTEIIRDQYGVPHVYGKTDADAVF